MHIDPKEPIVTKRYRLLMGEMKDAMETSTGYFESKALHDQSDESVTVALSRND